MVVILAFGAPEKIISHLPHSGGMDGFHEEKFKYELISPDIPKFPFL